MRSAARGAPAPDRGCDTRKHWRRSAPRKLSPAAPQPAEPWDAHAFPRRGLQRATLKWMSP